MNTKEEFFAWEKAHRTFFNEFYKSRNWPFKRIYGKENKYYDVIALINGKWTKLEEKYLSRDYGDFLVETVQDTKTNDPGWFYYTKADYILWGVNEKLYAVNMSKLRPFVQLHLKDFNERISTKGWGVTKNVAIPWSCIEINKIGGRLL